MPMNNINLKGIQNALTSLESPWIAGEAAISLLTTDKKKLRLGVTPPPHEQSLEDLEHYVKGMKQSIQQQVLQKGVGFVKIAGVNNGAKKDFSGLLTESVALIVGQIMVSMEL